MPTVAAASNPKFQFFDSNGLPLVGGKLFTYAAGTTTPQTTYSNNAGTVPHANPIILDSRGEAEIWFDATLQYKLALKSATDVDIWTVDGVNRPDASTLAALALPTGSSLIGYVSDLSGAVARTVQDKLRDTLYAEDFRLPGDPDDTLSIQRILNLGRFCSLRANKTYVAHGLVAVANTGIVCPGGRATISVPAGANRTGISVQVNNFIIDSVNWDGGNMGPYNSGPGTFGSRNGILIGNPFGTGVSLRGIAVSNCDIYGFDVAGIQGREIQIGFVFGYKCTFTNVNCYNCLIGFWYSPRFEYVVSQACYGYDCFAGVIMGGGNNTNIGCHYENNKQNCQMATGENDAHGQFVACSFNHAYDNFGAGLGLYALDIVNGHSFTGCAFWFGSIKLENSIGIQIRNSQIVISSITIQAGGLNSIDDNWIKDPIVPTLIGFTFTSFRRNRTNAADPNPQAEYPDVYMIGQASTFGFPIAWNTTSITPLPMVYATKKWMGVDAAFLQQFNFAYVPRTGIYIIDATITFTTLGVSQGLELRIDRINLGGVVQETVSAYEDFPASTVGCTVNKRIEMMAINAEFFRLQLRTSTATGVSITGIDVRIRTIN